MPVRAPDCARTACKDSIEEVPELMEAGGYVERVAEYGFVKDSDHAVRVLRELEDVMDEVGFGKEITSMNESVRIKDRRHVLISPVDRDRTCAEGVRYFFGTISRGSFVLVRYGETVVL